MKMFQRHLRQLRKKSLYLVMVVVIGIWLFLQSSTVEIPDENVERKYKTSEKEIDSGGQHIGIEGNMINLQPQINTSHLSQHHISIEASPPEQLARRLRTKCQKYLATLPKTSVTFPITTNRQHKLLLCPMCKLASTFWTKFFKMLEIYDTNTNISSPYDIPISIAKPTKERIKLTRGKAGTYYDSYYKFMFVRDPYSRILSAYIDKLFAPNPTFWRTVSSRAIKMVRDKSKPRSKCGSDLTFEEYVQAINRAHKLRFETGMVDCHDASFISYCHPCELKMDFVGKMEQITTDSNFLFQKLNLNRTIETLKRDGKRLADEDALYDTVSSPFHWKNDIKRCVPWLQALKRIWRKLQIRGVIGKQQLILTEEEAEKITQEQFFDLIRKTQAKTSYEQRKLQRTESLIEIYSQVNIQYLNDLKTSYEIDFDLFEYSDSPENIFKINRANIEHYGYLDI